MDITRRQLLAILASGAGFITGSYGLVEGGTNLLEWWSKKEKKKLKDEIHRLKIAADRIEKKTFTRVLLSRQPEIEGLESIVEDIEQGVLARDALNYVIGPRFIFDKSEKRIFGLEEEPFISKVFKFNLTGKENLPTRENLWDATLFDAYRTTTLSDLLNTLTWLTPDDEELTKKFVQNFYRWNYHEYLDKKKLSIVPGRSRFDDILYAGRGDLIPLPGGPVWPLTIQRDGKSDHLVLPTAKGADDFFIPLGFFKAYRNAHVPIKIRGKIETVNLTLNDYLISKKPLFPPNPIATKNSAGENIIFKNEKDYIRPDSPIVKYLTGEITDGCISKMDKIRGITDFVQTYSEYDSFYKGKNVRTPPQILLNGAKDCFDGTVLGASMLLSIGIPILAVSMECQNGYHSAIAVSAEDDLPYYYGIVDKNPKGFTLHDGRLFALIETTAKKPIGSDIDGRILFSQPLHPEDYSLTRKYIS